MIILITGATSGIGKATAEKFASAGHTLILTGRREERLIELRTQLITRFDIKVTTLCFDIRDREATESALLQLAEDLTPDVLVNNAGLAAGLSPLQDGQIDHWERMIDTNVKGLLYISRLISNQMIKRGRGGHIVNIGSIAGKEVYANGNVYCATKHAVDALTRGMRIDLLPHRIKVTSISPGMVETEFSIVRFDGDEQRARKVYEGMQPLKGEDIAEAVYWAITQPKHVSIGDIVIMPTDQASATNVVRR